MTSFHAGSDRELINLVAAREKLAVARIVGEYTKGDREHRLEIRIIKEQNGNGGVRVRKEVLLDGAKKRAREVIGHFNAVLFLPQMMQVVEGSPEQRRRYLNLALSQVLPNYANTLSEYRKVLSQRNALLKQIGEKNGSADQLSFWDERLVKHGAQIIAHRIQAIREIDRITGCIHHEITSGDEVLRLDYRPAYDPLPDADQQPSLLYTPPDRGQFSQEKIESGFLEKLAQLRPVEIARGVTTIGPHRDDLAFLANGMDLGIYGSRGQVRTTMMTMKLAEVEWMKAKTGRWPVLLLDEVLAELDEDRRADLLDRVSQSEQALLTTTDMLLFDPEIVKDWQHYSIQAGALQKT
jgi:DNA replication and repair protein RecF